MNTKRIIEDIDIDSIISDLPEDRKQFVDHAFEISRCIRDRLKDYPKKYWADKLNVSEAEISKWLSGTHNFTLRTISKLEAALSIRIINPEIKSTWNH